MTHPTGWRSIGVMLAVLCLPNYAFAAEGTTPQEDSGGMTGFLNGSFVHSAVAGDVALDMGIGGEAALGARIGATTIRLVAGATGHRLRHGESLAVGDVTVVARNWGFTWFGVDQQFYFRDDRRAGPFLCAGAAFCYLTHDQGNHVSGFRLDVGAGHEIAIHRKVSLLFVAQADYVRAGSATAANQRVSLHGAFDEIVLTAKVGFSVYGSAE